MNIFAETGVHVLVDGQFGSTGKGLFAAYLAEKALDEGVDLSGVISNAGPNSGHTFYDGSVKHVLKQLPSFAVMSALLGKPVPAYLSSGSVIDPYILAAEAERYPDVTVVVHPNAAVITPERKDEEKQGSIFAVAGTRSGTGAAIAAKVMRDPDAVWGPNGCDRFHMPDNVITHHERELSASRGRWFMEVSQGFSLGINSQFYPKVTSRECTVMQGIADARIAPQLVKRVMMVVRTFPIRVGNADGFSSGSCYPDQREISWTDIGIKPELTTVTKRPRRIFTFSFIQFAEAMRANRPDVVLVNFMNYLTPDQQGNFWHNLQRCLDQFDWPIQLLTGHGPRNSDIVPF